MYRYPLKPGLADHGGFRALAIRSVQSVRCLAFKHLNPEYQHCRTAQIVVPSIHASQHVIHPAHRSGIRASDRPPKRFRLHLPTDMRKGTAVHVRILQDLPASMRRGLRSVLSSKHLYSFITPPKLSVECSGTQAFSILKMSRTIGLSDVGNPYFISFGLFPKNVRPRKNGRFRLFSQSMRK